MELGEHGTGFNLEVVHDAETGDLAIHVYDGHASNPVRIKQESITLTVGTEKKEVVLAAVANPAYEESVGDTSFFQAKGALLDTKEFEGSVKSVTIKGTSFEDFRPRQKTRVTERSAHVPREWISADQAEDSLAAEFVGGT